MVAPVIVRNFAAVEVATGLRRYYLNRQRLEDAIQMLKSAVRLQTSAAMLLREKYPALTPGQIYDYLGVAQACIDYNVKP